MRRLLAALAVAALCAVLTVGALWVRGRRPLAGLPAGAAVTVARLGYWQRATLTGEDRAGLIAALGSVRARDALPPTVRQPEGRDLPPEGDGTLTPGGESAAPPRGDLYGISVGSATVVFRPTAGTITYRGRRFRLPPVADLALRQVAADVEGRFHGKLVTWAEADRLFPRRADATVVDLATGLRFRVRRLAGSRHADVQPLTAADSAVMQRIYGGGWSWARRPILVETGGMRLAASMNGMPHGAGAIEGNQFPGHFCIHFLFSEIHRSGRIDPEHLRSVLEAAGVRWVGPVSTEPPVQPTMSGDCGTS